MSLDYLNFTQMETLRSPFHAKCTTKHHHLLQIPSFKVSAKMNNSQPQALKLRNMIFDPIKRLFKRTTSDQSFDDFTHYTKQQPSLLANIFNALDDFICSSIDLPHRPSFDPKNVLTGSFEPVDELPPTACTVVEGSLPPCLDGAYIRNGPNPQFFPRSPYHFLDGDGMLHVVKISRGEVTFCCRYVRTHKYEAEREIGYPFVPNLFACVNGRFVTMAARLVLTAARVLAGQYDPMNHGFGVANTSVALLAGRIFAMYESDIPYEVKITEGGDVITLGRHNFHSSEPLPRMCAHPKTDRETGEVFAYRYDVVRPYLTLYRIDGEGRKQQDVPIFSAEKCTVFHDFAVTETRAVFCESQIVVDPAQILRGKPPVGTDHGRIQRLGIIPRHAADEGGMRWVDAPGFNMLHCANAWDEDGGATVVMVATNIVTAESLFEDTVPPQLVLEMVRIDVEAKTVRRRALCHKFLEFAIINPVYASKKNRYVYAVVVGLKALVGVVKLDLSLTDEYGHDCTVASRLYGLGCTGGEPFFVPREPNNPAAEEDDGYLITYLHDETTQKSRFIVMDAKSPTLDIIAAVELPQRVPTGFHGLFVSQKDLKKL